MDERGKWRQRARRAPERYFQKHSFPRFTLGLLLILTGGIGFFISVLLLRFGLSIAGWALEALAPGSRSIGPALEELL